MPAPDRRRPACARLRQDVDQPHRPTTSIRVDRQPAFAPTTCPTCGSSPTDSEPTTTPSSPASPHRGDPARSKDRTPGPSWPNASAAAARTSTCSANGSCFKRETSSQDQRQSLRLYVALRSRPYPRQRPAVTAHGPTTPMRPVPAAHATARRVAATSSAVPSRSGPCTGPPCVPPGVWRGPPH